ncbi:membrane-spanning 4-domains subfamily A member 5-like isoform X1 [Hoplias malabaricus]|uniref:membrane-spanning 4-domains subfamily A member 5-like isoform X1 n=1 Tax=Hoplias malabaricus TaxID=27720 RepID=UPI0034633C31
MSAPAVPLTHTGPGYTAVNHMVSLDSATAQTRQNPPSYNPLQRFLRREPKALGTFQIMTGLITVLLGIVLITHNNPLIIIFSGIFLWGSSLYITAGALAVSVNNKSTTCHVIGCLVMNVLSAIAAGIAIIFLSLDIVYWHRRSCGFQHGQYDTYNPFQRDCLSMVLGDGILGVLLVFTAVQLIVSICISAFACKVCCCNKQMVNVTVVANPGGYNSVVNPFPQQPAPSNQQWVYTASGASTSCPPMGNLPMGNPPMYSPQDFSEVKSQLYN